VKKMECPNCGTKLNGEANCPKCGVPISYQAQETPTKTDKAVASGIGCLGLGCIIPIVAIALLLIIGLIVTTFK
jgi:uncharacterized membrane protein YvbJ